MTNNDINLILKRKIKRNQKPLVIINSETLQDIGKDFIHANFIVKPTQIGYSIMALPHKVEQLKFNLYE